MAGDQLKGQSPLAGVVMCCTSISPDKRHEIAVMAQEMGAEHKYDLTSDVTHLIVGSVATNKYQYVAKERPDVKVLLPSFVEAVRESWLVDAEPDVEALEIEHRAPALFGLRICLTGFEDFAQREDLNAKIQHHGAESHCDLTRDIVTHLIVKKPEGRKYAYALKWGTIHIVSLKWLSDTLERGMVLDEALYNPVFPAAQQGIGAWKRQPAELASLGKRQRQESSTNSSAATGKRKLRRTTSAKLESQQENLWADIADAASNKAADELQQEHGQNDRSNIQEAQLHLGRQEVEAERKRKHDGAQVNNLQEVRGNALNCRHHRNGIFQGAIVCSHGFEEKKTSILQEHLKSHGARVIAVSELDADETMEESFLIVPHDLPSYMMPPIPSPAERLKRVTEWWVESCLQMKSLVDPEDDPLVRPFAKLSIKGLQDMVVCSTGFKDFDLLHLSKVVKLMGGAYDEYLKPTTSVLVCRSPSANVQKLQFAAEHGIPAVSLGWVMDSIQHGEVQPFESYVLQPILRNSRDKDRSRPPRSKTTSSSLRSTSICAEKSQEYIPIKPGPLQNTPTSQHPSQPLRELSDGNRNLPPPKSSSSPDKDKEGQPEGPAPHEHFDPRHSPGRNSISEASFASPPTRSENLNHSIAVLLAQKEVASARRASIPDTANSNLARRKHGLLGRATSGLSNASSANDALEPLPVPSQNEANKDGLPVPTQGQKIGWSERHEAESIGMVKDVVGSRGVGRRKTRNG